MLRALPNIHFLKDPVTTTLGAHVRSFSVLGAYSLPKILRKFESLAISCFGSLVLRASDVFDMYNPFGDGTFPLSISCIALGEPLLLWYPNICIFWEKQFRTKEKNIEYQIVVFSLNFNFLLSF